MLFNDTYNELSKQSKGVYKERGSKFVAYAYKILSKEDAKIKIQHIKKTEHGANHYCYAYVIYKDQSFWKIDDDGEPSSTAGKPILRQIRSNNLTNSIIIVARYFGGIKLGISGLIRSYKTAAANAINNSEIIHKYIKEQFLVSFSQQDINIVMSLIKKYNLQIISTDLSINSKISFTINRNKSDRIISIFKQYNNIKIEHEKTI